MVQEWNMTNKANYSTMSIRSTIEFMWRCSLYDYQLVAVVFAENYITLRCWNTICKNQSFKECKMNVANLTCWTTLKEVFWTTFFLKTLKYFVFFSKSYLTDFSEVFWERFRCLFHSSKMMKVDIFLYPKVKNICKSEH